MEQWRVFCIPVGWDRLEKNDRSIGKNVEQLELPHIAGGSAKHFSHSGKLFGSF